MSEKEQNYQQVTRTTIDLKIVQQQLDTVESALIMAWRHMGRAAHMPEQEQQISEAIDTLLAVKKSFGLTSDLIPVKEQPIASHTEHIMMPREWPSEEKNV